MNLKIAGVDRWRFRVFYGASIVLEVFLGQTGQTVRQLYWDEGKK